MGGVGAGKRLVGGEKVTSVDVARLAGVSQSAVSRFFTPGTSVSKKTADKIRVAADELGYRPNVLARSLITGKSRIIGLVVAYLENYFYPEVVEQLSKALQVEGYHVLVFISSLTADHTEQIMQEILDYQVDGIVLASVSVSSGLAARCRAAGSRWSFSTASRTTRRCPPSPATTGPAAAPWRST
jgi:DNA-binding LacI/PurR family transcriptional regulator